MKELSLATRESVGREELAESPLLEQLAQNLPDAIQAWEEEGANAAHGWLSNQTQHITLSFMEYSILMAERRTTSDAAVSDRHLVEYAGAADELLHLLRVLRNVCACGTIATTKLLDAGVHEQAAALVSKPGRSSSGTLL